jgi:hypothetical protein
VKAVEEERAHFRWSIVLVIAAAALAAWLVKGIDPARSWEEFMDAIGVENKVRYTQLAILGMVVVAIVAVARVLRRKEEE